jgi:hypothetical protein
MEFKAAQIDQLRVHLAEYREANKIRATEPLSLELVLADMQACPEVPVSFFQNQKPKALNNRLWRFTRGATSEKETLEALHSFLTFKSAEPDEAFDGDEEVMAVHGLMANGSVEARRVFQAIREGEYVARPFEGSESSVELRFLCDREKMIIWVEEHSYSPDVRRNQNNTSTVRGTGRGIRKGYGFLSTERYLLHIFLVGCHARDRVHYVELGAFVSEGHPYLLRIGGYADGTTRAVSRSFPPEDTTQFYDVLHFKSRVLQAQERKEHGLTPPGDATRLHGSIPGLAWGVLPAGTRTGPNFLERELIEAVKTNSFQYTKAALKQGANPNFKDDEGMTALHHAAAIGARTSLRMLVASGKCDYLIADKRGRFPSDLAIEWSRDFAVARLLTRKRLEQAHAQGIAPRGMAAP